MTTVVIRPFNAITDSGFIYSTWPKNMYFGSYYAIPLSKKRWFKIFYDHVKEVLSEAKVFIASPSNEPDTIMGYSIINGTALEFVYVKEKYRNQGIGGILVKNKGIKDCVNLTKIGKAILDDHPDLFKLKNRLETITEEIQEKPHGN